MNLFKKLEKENGNISKSKSIYLFILAIIFIIAFLSFVVLCIDNIFFGSNQYDVNNIEQYIQKDDGSIDNSKLVKSYSEFHTIQEILQQYIDKLLNSEFDVTYNLLDKEMLEKYGKKSEYVKDIEAFRDNNLVLKNANDYFERDNILKNLYKISPDEYIAEYKVVNDNVKKIGIRLDSRKKTYKIFYIEM